MSFYTFSTEFKNNNLTDDVANIVKRFDPKLLDRIYLTHNGLLDPKTIATDEQISDILSHVIQWNQCVEENRRRTIINDKTSIPPNFDYEHMKLISEMKYPWDIIIWGVDYNGVIVAKMPHELGDCIIKLDDNLSVGSHAPLQDNDFTSTMLNISLIDGLAAYTVSPQGALKLLKELPIKNYSFVNKFTNEEKTGVNLNFIFSSLIKNKEISAYISFPPLVVGKLPEDIFPSIGKSGEYFDYSRTDMKDILDQKIADCNYDPIHPEDAKEFPKIIHFVETSSSSDPLDEVGFFSNNKHPGVRPFSFSHYMAIRSAKMQHPNFRVIVWCLAERSGPYWDAIRQMAEIIIVPNPERIFGNPIIHPAHKSDVIRMCVLLNYGGIYLDFDTITTRNFLPICSTTRTVMASELKSTLPRIVSDRLGNAIIVSPSNALFMRIWWDTYKHFDSRHWAQSSTQMPYLISKMQPNTINVLEPETFFVPSWDTVGLKDLFADNKEFPQSFAFHLWESRSWPVLKQIDETVIFESNNTYSNLCKKYIDSTELDRLIEIKNKYNVFNDDKEISNSMSYVFNEIYKNNEWGGEGIVYSGIGSDPERCADYINFIVHYIQRSQSRVVIDIGCGDFRVGSQIAKLCPNTHFIGMDIVENVIHHNRKKYSEIKNVSFKTLNIVEEIPKIECDLVIIKDVFQHLSNESIIKAFFNLKYFKEIVIVNYTLPEYPVVNEDKEDGRDIRGGRLDFSIAPFKFKVELLAKLIIKGCHGVTEIVRYIPSHS